MLGGAESFQRMIEKKLSPANRQAAGFQRCKTCGIEIQVSSGESFSSRDADANADRQND